MRCFLLKSLHSTQWIGSPLTIVPVLIVIYLVFRHNSNNTCEEQFHISLWQCLKTLELPAGIVPTARWLPTLHLRGVPVSDKLAETFSLSLSLYLPFPHTPQVSPVQYNLSTYNHLGSFSEIVDFWAALQKADSTGLVFSPSNSLFSNHIMCSEYEMLSSSY